MFVCVCSVQHSSTLNSPALHSAITVVYALHTQQGIHNPVVYAPLPSHMWKSYAGCFNLSMWFLVNDQAIIRPRCLCNQGLMGTFNFIVGGNRDILASRQAFAGARDTQPKIGTVPVKSGLSW